MTFSQNKTDKENPSTLEEDIRRLNDLKEDIRRLEDLLEENKDNRRSSFYKNIMNIIISFFGTLTIFISISDLFSQRFSSKELELALYIAAFLLSVVVIFYLSEETRRSK